MQFIRQGSTHKVVIGPVVAVGDGFTPVTTLSLSTADEAEVILHDNGTVVDISAYTFAAITTADGYYHLTLQSGISNTIGHMTVVINDDSLCLPVRADFTVVEEAVYDNLFASSAVGPLAANSNGSGLTEAGGTGDQFTAIPWNASWDAEVQSEVNDGLVALGLDHLVSASVTGTDVTDDSIFAKIVSKNDIAADWDDFDNTTDSLQGQIDKILTYVQLIVRKDAAIAIEYATDLNEINNDYGGGAGAYSNQTDSQEALRDWIGNGSNLTEAAGTGDHLTAINLPDQTMNITGNITGNLSGSVGSVTNNVGGNVTGSVGSLATQAKADVNAEVVDALQTDTPVAGVTIVEALRRIGTITSGKVTGAGTGTETFYDFEESASTLVIVVDSSGNRSSITYN